MTQLDGLTTRQLQLEVSRMLVAIGADNNKLSKYNKMTDHDSVEWYRNLLRSYIEEHGDLPSLAGPGKVVTLLHGDV